LKFIRQTLLPILSIQKLILQQSPWIALRERLKAREDDPVSVDPANRRKKVVEVLPILIAGLLKILRLTIKSVQCDPVEDELAVAVCGVTFRLGARDPRFSAQQARFKIVIH